MRMYKFIVLLYFIIIISCNTHRKNQEDKNQSIVTEDTIKNNSDTLSFDKEFVLSQYHDELLKALNENKIPEFIYDECLDAKEVAYCDLGSHKSCSLRYDLLKTLSLTQLEELLKLSKVNQLKKICEIGFVKEKLFGNNSTYDLVISLQSDKGK